MSQDNKIMFSIVVCTYNRCKYIYNTLSKIVNNGFDIQRYEILLINNNCTDETESECKRFESENMNKVNYRYIIENEQGLSFARNRGIKESKGEWIIFLDDDAYIQQGYLENLEKNITTNKTLSAFGGRIEPIFECNHPKWISKWSISWVSALDLGDKTIPFSGGKYPIGANMGIKKDVFDEVGLFNTELGRKGNSLLGGEEKDMFNRISNLGKDILYFPDVRVIHNIPESRTTTDFIKRMGYGIGVSEKSRTKNISSFSYFKRLGSEIVKWFGTLVLWLIFFLKNEKIKGDVLVLFRKEVSRGLI